MTSQLFMFLRLLTGLIKMSKLKFFLRFLHKAEKIIFLKLRIHKNQSMFFMIFFHDFLYYFGAVTVHIYAISIASNGNVIFSAITVHTTIRATS